MAVVGAGSFTGDVACKGCSTERIAALCDVDDAALASRLEEYPGARTFRDYRVMFDQMGDDIDAVTVSTPDHTHYPIAMAAIQRGKHVFVQKPLARTVGECRALRAAAREHGVITQMGNQGRTMDGIRTVREWVQAGVIGVPLEVHAWTDRPREPWFRKPDRVPPSPQTPPEHLDWDLWLGPAAARPYSSDYQNKRWRTWWDFGCGALGDMGCHILDTPFYALDLGPPNRIEVETTDPPVPEHTCFGAVVTYRWEGGDGRRPLTLTWYEGDNDILLPPDFEEDRDLAGNGMYIMGDKATVMTFGAQANNPRIVPEKDMVRLGDTLPPKTIPRVDCGPVEEWVRAIKGTGPLPGSDFEYAAPLTELVLLGALAIRTGQTIDWDAENMQVSNAPELNPLLQIAARPGWQV